MPFQFNSEGKIDKPKNSLIKKMSAATCLLKDFHFKNTVARVYGTSAVVSRIGVLFIPSRETTITNLNFLDFWIEREVVWEV